MNRTVLTTIFIALIMLFSLTCGDNLVRKGCIALELGDYPLAISFFSQQIERHPDDASARTGIGKAYLQQAADNPGDSSAWQLALRNLDAAHTLQQEDTSLCRLLAQAWVERGKQLLLTKDTLSAMEALTRAIAIDKTYPEPLNLAGIVYYQTGNPARARLLFERALESDTTTISTLFNLGMLNWEESAIEAAHALWFKALNIAPEDEELLYWFSAAEKRLRESTAARTTEKETQ